MNTLHLALIHSVLAHKKPAENREALRDQVSQAARAGAKVVLATELALSGYSYKGREAIADCVETADGPTFQALAPICREHGLFCCFGFAERDPTNGLLYNAATVIDSRGEIALLYRKINAECRWAVPGVPAADNTFATPWGRMGLLICADTYHALMPRMTALRGASLLLVPANWPVAGIAPEQIWRARALENGIHVAVANCGGMNGSMDCTTSVSGLFAPDGTVLARFSGNRTHCLHATLPLDARGKLPDRTRKQRLAERKPESALDCALHQSGIQNWTGFHELPDPGLLEIRVHGTTQNQSEPKSASSAPCLHLFPDSGRVPPAVWSGADQDTLILCGDGHIEIRGSGTATLRQPWPTGPDAPVEVLPWLECGPARLAVLSWTALFHPEQILARAKQGCDLLLFFLERLDEAQVLLARIRSIEQTAILACSPLGSVLCLPPKGHEPWQEWQLGAEGGVFRLDTHETRQKRFQDRIDYPVLLQPPSL